MAKIEEGKPLRLSNLDVIGLGNLLHEKNIRTSQGKIILPLHDAHREILTDEGRFKVLSAGRRFSKSLLAALSAIAVFMQPSRKIWIVAPTYNHAEKVFRECWHIIVNQLKLVQPGSKNKGRGRNQKGEYFLQSPWGSVIEAKSMERPDSLAGDALDFIVVDEAALQENLDDVWNQMLMPTLLDKEGSALLISSPRGRNDFYKLYQMGQLGLKQRNGEVKIIKDPETGISNDVSDWSSFRKTSYDNPFLASSPEKSKEEIDGAYRRAILSGKVIKFKQEYLADFDAVADIVFPEFKEEATEEYKYPNVVDYNWHPDNGLLYTSSDYNYAKPASTIYAQINNFGEVIIFDEDFTPNTTTYMQAQHILDKCISLDKQAKKIWKSEGKHPKEFYPIQFEAVIGDISGDQSQLNGRTAWDDFEEILGVRPVGLKQPREVGCNMVRQFLQTPMLDERGRPLLKENNDPVTCPRLYISNNCRELIFALSAAKFKQGKQGLVKEDYNEMTSGHEGLLDALRYLLVYIFHERGNNISISGGF